MAERNQAYASAKMFYEANVQFELFNEPFKMYTFQREDLQINFKVEPSLGQDENKEEQGVSRGPRTADSDNSKFPYFSMGLALLSAMRSRDPKTQVGSCIVKDDGKVIALGHNQMPKGENDKYTWARGEELVKRDNKHLYVCHAELNAIVNCTDVKGCTIYVTLFPCHECAKLIIKAGIEKVVHLSDKYAERPETKASRSMLVAKGIQLVSFYQAEEPEREPIVIKFE